ncbi:MAG: translesion error-prone DNA polymerase V autoproteolytic subunit [Spirochaetales bacterium]|nr:translesion error-prone DNA polymerase V autoproteolytic subunit [Spirochaetales bacterium]
MLRIKEPQQVQRIPMYTDSIPAGFPSPATDYEEDELDLNEFLIKHPAASYFLRVSGDSMRDAGILASDIIVVDRSLRPISGDIIVGALNGEFTVKTLLRKNGQLILHPENSEYQDILIGSEEDFTVFGVVTGVVRKTGRMAERERLKHGRFS